MPLDLDSLCARCGVTRYDMASWLSGATLHPPHLYIHGGPDTKAWITKHYLARFREHIPGLELMQHAPKPAARQKAETKFPSIKPGPWRDLLDSQES